jgi:hypothetical protein
MKKTFTLAILMIASIVLKAQYLDETYDWYPRQIGIKTGIISTTFNASKTQPQGSSASSTSQLGSSSSVAYWIPITQVFRPRLELSLDILNADVDYKNTFSSGATFSFIGSTKLTQASFAILPELVFGRNIQFSVYGGFQFSALLSAYQKGTSTTTDSTNTFVSVVSVDQKNNNISEGIDSGILTGFGMRYRLSKRFILHAESRFRFGTTMVYGIYKPYYWGVSVGCIYQL